MRCWPDRCRAGLSRPRRARLACKQQFDCRRPGHSRCPAWRPRAGTVTIWHARWTPMPAVAVFFHDVVAGEGDRGHISDAAFMVESEAAHRFVSAQPRPAPRWCESMTAPTIDILLVFESPAVYFFGPLPICVRPLGTGSPACHTVRRAVMRVPAAPISRVVIGNGIARLCNDVRRLNRRRP